MSACSPRPPRLESAWLADHLRALLGPVRGQRLCLALSGGLDSSALLHALAGLRARERFGLRALHVDHHLQPQSDAWARQALAQARRLRVRCERIDLAVKRTRGASLEALAREARYRALLARLAPGEHLVTAHHQDDQLETVLLALLRGSGVPGLSGMRALAQLGGHLLVRPLLALPRSAIERYARAQRLSWVEDATNADTRFDRNYLRGRVIPLLRARWPAAASTAARSAGHLAEAQELLAQSARARIALAADGAALRAAVLRRWSDAERRSVLRQWLMDLGLALPDHRRLRELAGPLLTARADALPCVSWPGAQVRRHGDVLLASPWPGPGRRSGSDGISWNWRSQRWLTLEGGGALGLVPDVHGDVALGRLPARLTVRFRHGGERLAAPQGRRALKDVLQSERVAPWERGSVPLVLDEQRIVAVADLWLHAHYAAHPGHDAPDARGRFRWRRAFARLNARRKRTIRRRDPP